MNLKDMQWLTFRNDSGEEIPAFACMRCTGLALIDDGSVVLKMAKPNTYGAQFGHYFNGPIKIASGLYGLCTRSPAAAAVYDSVDGTPAFGEQWGPRSGTWKLKKNTGGFEVLGVTNTTDKIVCVHPAPMLTVHGVTDAAVSKNGNVGVSVYVKTSTTYPYYTDTGEFVPASNSFGDIPSGRDVVCRWEANDGSNGYWEIIAGDVC